MLIFIHVPGFYAAVEQADEVSLRDRPVVVGGDPGKGGRVTSASREAAEKGVDPGMTLAEAARRCADLELRATRLPRYREVSAEMRALLGAICERLEPVALDGLYLEPPQDRETLELAATLCVRLQAELSLRAVAGVGPTRFVAQLAAHHAGPGGVRRVTRTEVARFLRDLPVTEVWGLGPSTAERRAAHGVSTIGELRDFPVDQLRALVGRQASAFRELARGEDQAPLRPPTPLKSLSREKTIDPPTADLRVLGESLAELALRLEERLQRERRSACTISLGVRFAEGDEVSRTLTRVDAVRTRAEIQEISLELLSRTRAGERSVRGLRLRATNLDPVEAGSEPRQLRLF
jgi:DNA polymerase-4